MRSRVAVSALCAVWLTVPAGVVFAQNPPTATPSAATASTSSGYKLGPGDKIRVLTYGEAALTGEFQVDGSGLVALPLIGNLKAGDLTARELQSAIEAALRNGYLKEPQVSVEVLTFRPFYILGEVNKPGTYPYTDGLTVLNAVATAQGFTYRANTKRVYVKHLGQSQEERVGLTADLPVVPGDTIRIGERLF